VGVPRRVQGAADRVLLAPNAYLALAVGHLFTRCPRWPRAAGVSKTVVTSGLLDLDGGHARENALRGTGVGFRWFVDPLLEGRCAFAGEESVFVSLLRRDGTPWTTEKDGILLNLLRVEIASRAGRDLADVYREWTKQLGEPQGGLKPPVPP
jgi:phosphoglucomutase